ncbi:MAG: hypothetical protein WBG58_10160 [Ignavibacteriaceae bacterium]
MIKYFQTSLKVKLSFLGVIIFFTNTYPFQDSIKSQVTTPDTYNQDTVASVGPVNISVEEFYNSYEFGPAFVKRKKDSKKRYLNYMINEKLLALDGYSRGVDKNDDVESILKDFENDIATEEMFKVDILSKIEISDEEIDTVITQKQLELDVRWFYAETGGELNKFTDALASGISFDSLYLLQFKDSIYLDDRSMKINRFQLGKKNPELAAIIDTLPVGQVTEPIKAFDGWYIFILDNIMQNVIIPESELMRLQQESINFLKKKKMDQISDKYVNQLLLAQDPVIKRQSFNVLRSFIGNYTLTKEIYEDWELSEKLDAALTELQVTKEDVGQSVLVKMNEGYVTLEEFLKWYRNRSQYVKLDKNDLRSFSKSLENLIWRMLRDKLLSEKAYKRNFHHTESFEKQAKWWKEKIVYSAVKREIIESVALEQDEVILNKPDSLSSESKDEIMRLNISRQLLNKINKLKNTYNIKINENVLENVIVSEENNPKAIDFYTVKKGGLIPRTPYPTIDFEWINWE